MRPYSSMDRAQACGAWDVGSIPTRDTSLSSPRRVKSFNYDTETASLAALENDTKEGINLLVKL